MLLSLLFMIPIMAFGVETIFAVQDALGFGDPLRQGLLIVLLLATFYADERYGPRASQREREGRR